MRHSVFTTALVLAIWGAAAPAQPVPGEVSGPQPAGVVTLAREEVPVSTTLSGQAAAVDEATIRPLVDGVVEEVLYTPGRPLTAGMPLFRIDPRSYEAALASARASRRSAEAALPAAQATVVRYESLVGTGITQETLEGARVTLAQAEAAIAQAEADVQVAEINLGRTLIASPIDGIADIAGVSVGDLVTAGQSDALTTVTSLDPIYVDLSEASARMLQLRDRIESGQMRPGTRLAVALTLENGRAYAGTGTLASIGSRVSTTTGTINIRLRFENPDRLILPGMFVRAMLTVGTSDAFLVPQLAAVAQADGTLRIWVLDAENRARERFVTAIGSTESAWIVSDGIEEGTRLMVDNIDNMTAGTEIAPVAVVIDAQGVVRDVPQGATAAGPGITSGDARGDDPAAGNGATAPAGD